ncbi:MAG: VOC family protein [Planctomycetes bacterium]|nr:VOC family protein [Planctomycetota bacterium]
MSAKLTAAVPILPVADMAATIDFYTNKLGFQLAFQWGESGDGKSGDTVYAGIVRDGIRVHLNRFGDPALARKVASQTMVRFDVSDVRTYYDECRVHEGVIHPNGKLDEKPWGTIEFGVLDPSGVCITFQQAEE